MQQHGLDTIIDLQLWTFHILQQMHFLSKSHQFQQRCIPACDNWSVKQHTVDNKVFFIDFIILFHLNLTGMHNALNAMAFVLNTLHSERKTVKIFNYN